MQRTAGGFEGNAHTLRLIAKLEKYTEPGRGINPTRRFALGILKYPAPYSSFDTHACTEPPKCYFDEETDIVEWALEGFSGSDHERFSELATPRKPKHRTFDASLMELADDIAYGIHDIENLVARRLASKDHWEEALKESFEAIGGALTMDDGALRAGNVLDALFESSFTRKRMIGRLV